jgi:hypothetical protein
MRRAANGEEKAKSEAASDIKIQVRHNSMNGGVGVMLHGN